MSINVTGGDLLMITIVVGYIAVQISAIRALRDIEKSKQSKDAPAKEGE